MAAANRQLSISNNFEQLSHAAAENFGKHNRARTTVHERFSRCSSGGSTARNIYEILAKNLKTGIPRRNVDLFWVDERCGTPVDDESNYGLVWSLL
jgi:6-phosphogluconolactonase